MIVTNSSEERGRQRDDSRPHSGRRCKGQTEPKEKKGK
jgi:hypothetical protein